MQLDCEVGSEVGWIGMSWTRGRDALANVRARVQGYPGDKPGGTQWKMTGTTSASQKKMVFYPMDTGGGQSGSPVYRPNQPGCGVCGVALHAYGRGHGTGSHWSDNHGPRITRARYHLILDLADNNAP
jgi:glutamyl endopeptidase